jgi:hypothetical protein
MRLLQSAVSLAIVLAIWAAVSALQLFPEAIVPTPLSVLAAVGDLYNQGLLFSDLATASGAPASASSSAPRWGVAIGVLTGRTRLLRALLNPFLTVLRPIPAIALVPVAIVWFGIGEGSKYFVISYTVFLTVWFNTHQGMEYVPDIYTGNRVDARAGRRGHLARCRNGDGTGAALLSVHGTWPRAVSLGTVAMVRAGVQCNAVRVRAFHVAYVREEFFLERKNQRTFDRYPGSFHAEAPGITIKVFLLLFPQKKKTLPINLFRMARLVPAAEFDGTALSLPGTAIMPGIVDAHRHVVEPFVKALSGGEPARPGRFSRHCVAA